MKHRTLAAQTVALVAFALAPSAHAGPTGNSLPNYSVLEDFLDTYLHGRRVEELYFDPKTDQAYVDQLDERLEVMAEFLGFAGTPLRSIREDLNFGMTWREYAADARFAVDDIMELLTEQSWAAPKVYWGAVDEHEAVFLVRWHSDRRVNSIYQFSPAAGQERFYALAGHNNVEGRLQFAEYTGRTKTADVYMKKKLDYSRIIWWGERRAGDRRGEKIEFWRTRDRH